MKLKKVASEWRSWILDVGDVGGMESALTAPERGQTYTLTRANLSVRSVPELVYVQIVEEQEVFFAEVRMSSTLEYRGN